MLRTLALALLLANALLLAAQLGAFEGLVGPGIAQPGQREPARLQRQVNPEAVRILTPQATSAALQAAAASVAQAAAAASSAQALSCLEAGPFAPAEAQAAERALREAGLPAGSWAAHKADDAGEYMVYMGRYADRETLERKLEELGRRSLEITPEELRQAPDLQPGISLGRHASKPAADAALARLLQRGVRTARVITLRPAQTLTVLRAPAADAAQRSRLVALRLPSGPGFVACSAEAEAEADAAAAASAASAAASTPR